MTPVLSSTQDKIYDADGDRWNRLGYRRHTR